MRLLALAALRGRFSFVPTQGWPRLGGTARAPVVHKPKVLFFDKVSVIPFVGPPVLTVTQYQRVYSHIASFEEMME
jgi:hypothetical protein